jgi:hypothetical protein
MLLLLVLLVLDVTLSLLVASSSDVAVLYSNTSAGCATAIAATAGANTDGACSKCSTA